MGKMSKLAAAAALLAAPAEVDSQIWFDFNMMNRHYAPIHADRYPRRSFHFSVANVPGYCNYIPHGFAGPMIYWHSGVPLQGFYSSGVFATPHIRLDLSAYEMMVPVQAPLPYEMMTRERFRGASVEDGEGELLDILYESGVKFEWEEYVRRSDNRGYYKVDAIIGRHIFDVVHTGWEEGGEARERSENIQDYVYHPIIANEFESSEELRGGVRQEVSPFLRKKRQ